MVMPTQRRELLMFNFGDWLREKRAGRNGAVLGEEAGIEASNISRLENKSDIQPTMATVVRLCRVFQIDWSEFYESVTGQRHWQEVPLIGSNGADGFPNLEELGGLLRSGKQNLSEVVASGLTLACVRRVEGFDAKKWAFEGREVLRFCEFGGLEGFPVKTRVRAHLEDQKSAAALAAVVGRAWATGSIIRPGDMSVVVRARCWGSVERDSLLRRVVGETRDNLRLGDSLELDRRLGQRGDLFGMAWRMGETRVAMAESMGGGDGRVGRAEVELVDWLVYVCRQLALSGVEESLRGVVVGSNKGKGGKKAYGSRS